MILMVLKNQVLKSLMLLHRVLKGRKIHFEILILLFCSQMTLKCYFTSLNISHL